MVRCVLLVALLALAGCGGDDSGGGGGGKTHALNETVVVQNADSSAPDNPKSTVAITPIAVRKGTQAQLEQAGFNLDPDEKTATPYYVDLRVENRGPATIDDGLGVSMEDDKGGSISSTTVIELGDEPFKECPQAKAGGKLATGDKLESCRLFMVPKGRTPDKLSFLPYDPKKPTDFVFWKVSS